MSKVTRFFGISILVAMVIIVIVYLYLNFAVTAFHHERIESALSDAIGYDVSAGQSFDLRVAREISFSAHDVSVNHAEWSDSDPLASVGRLYVTINTWAALTSPWGTFVQVELDDIDVHLQEADGRPPNWVTASSQSTSEDSDNTTTTMIDIRLAGIRARASQNGTETWSLESDLQATAGVALNGTAPAITLVLDAPSIALAISEVADEEADTEQQERLFTDAPFDLSSLTGFGLTANVLAEKVELNSVPIGQFATTFGVFGGGVRIEQFDLAGPEDSVSGSLDVRPTPDAYDVTLNVQLTNWRSELLAIDGVDRDEIPPFNGELVFNGTGNSMQTLMANANGRVSGRHSSGSVDLKAAGPLFSDIATGLLETLNPLAESDTQTALDCGVYEISVADGLATVEQFSVQTDKLTVISSGEIDLGSETIDMALRTKSREGLGLSVGSVATSFVRLGGTLNEPSIDVDAGGTVTTAGAAVATGGLSVLAKGLWDRLSAEADLCRLPEDEQPEEDSPES